MRISVAVWYLLSVSAVHIPIQFLCKNGFRNSNFEDVLSTLLTVFGMTLPKGIRKAHTHGGVKSVVHMTAVVYLKYLNI